MMMMDRGRLKYKMPLFKIKAEEGKLTFIFCQNLRALEALPESELDIIRELLFEKLELSCKYSKQRLLHWLFHDIVVRNFQFVFNDSKHFGNLRPYVLFDRLSQLLIIEDPWEHLASNDNHFIINRHIL